MCYCFRSSNGTYWDKATGCEPNCVCQDDQPCKFPNGNLCECVWDPCDCEDRAADVLPGTGICTACDKGYVLSRGYCYVGAFASPKSGSGGDTIPLCLPGSVISSPPAPTCAPRCLSLFSLQTTTSLRLLPSGSLLACL